MLELGCGIMQHLLDFMPNYPKTKLRCKSLTGVDVEQSYLDFLKDKGVETIQHDLTITPVPLPNKSFDIVDLVDILEHLPTLEHAEALIKEAERIAVKKVIVFTPSHFRAGGGSWEELGFKPNEHQNHRILLTPELFAKHGIKVRDIKDKGGLHHLYGVKNLQPSFLAKKFNGVLDYIFESRMETWRQRHGVIFEEGFCSGKVTKGKNTYVSNLASLNPNETMPIAIGDNCTVKEFCVLYGNLKIGNGVRIACNTAIITSRHNYEDTTVPIWLQCISSKGVVIEDDVWIGAGVTILDGVTIRKGSVIGAGSVVTQDTEIPPNSVAVGNPCRVIKNRSKKQ